MNEDTLRYLNTPGAGRQAVLKAQYLAHAPGDNAPIRERVLYHFEELKGFTRRLNMVECRTTNKPDIQPSLLLMTDLFACVEMCMQVIQETVLLDATFNNDKEFSDCWSCFVRLVTVLRSKGGRDDLVESAFLLLHLTVVIIARHIMDGTVEKQPSVLSLAEGYLTLMNAWPYPLFEPAQSPSEQLSRLANNLVSLSCILDQGASSN